MGKPWHEMTAREKVEDKKQRTLEGRLQWVKQLLQEGKTAQAEHYCGTYKLDLAEIGRDLQREQLAKLHRGETPNLHGDVNSVKAAQAAAAAEPVGVIAQSFRDTVVAPVEAELRADLAVSVAREVRADTLVAASGQVIHASDCATSNAPAEEPGPCDCDFVNGWPRRAVVEVWRYVRNPRLVAVRFDDGREASMWNARYPLGTRLKVKLQKETGDPIYEIDRDE